MRARTITAAAVLAGAVLACGAEEPTLDLPAVERAIAVYVGETFPFTTVGESVCPPEVEIGMGATFQCVVQVNDQPLRVEVTQEDDEADRITYVPVDAVLDMARVVEDVTGQVRPDFTGQVTVDCGQDEVRVIAPGTTFECRGSDPLGANRVIQVRVADVAGTLAITVV